MYNNKNGFRMVQISVQEVYIREETECSWSLLDIPNKKHDCTSVHFVTSRGRGRGGEKREMKKEKKLHQGNHNISFNFMGMHRIETHTSTVKNVQLWPVSKPRSRSRAERRMKCVPREAISVLMTFTQNLSWKRPYPVCSPYDLPLVRFCLPDISVMLKYDLRDGRLRFEGAVIGS
jgi:hypothetical protein